MRLHVVLGDHAHTAAVRNGTVKPAKAELRFEELRGPLPSYFRRMVREQAFDVCEMGITTYFAARKYGAPLVALPIFPSFMFPFRHIRVNAKAGITSPADLAGRRVGARTHTVTTVVWARGLLGDLFGLDSARVTWVINDHEHTKEFAWPGNVEFREGADLSALIDAGELAGGVGVYRGHSPDVEPLFPDLPAAEQDCYRRTGINPANHALVVREDLVTSAPDLIADVYQTFVTAKELFLRDLDAGAPDGGETADFMRRRAFMGRDPVPCGVAENARALNALVRYSKQQAILPESASLEGLFYEPSG